MTWFSPWLADHLIVMSIWLGALCTLGLYSVLYKENELFRFFEHVFLGLATGYLIANTWTDVLQPKWWKPMHDEGQWWYVLAMVAGLLYYFIFSKKYNWMARLIIGFFLGVASGQSFQSFVNGVWPQIPTSFKPIIPHGVVTDAAGKVLYKAVSVPDAINNVLFMVILLCVMSYFFFSFELKNKALKGSAQLGRWLLMFAFGAIFGSTIMARLALLIDRMDYMVNEVGGTMGPHGPMIMNFVMVGLGILLIVLALRSKDNGEATPEGSDT